ncbi:MAG: ABC transporter substrate-binding protein [Clostridiales Family XIII bacterium]|nr:ABC transporter substrate-binding protein [Clostridiales Family XIII bacterium]
MKKIRVVALFVALILVLTVFATGCGSDDASSGGSDEETIKIGILFPFSGSLAKLGEETYAGVEYAQWEINEAGGINGKQVEFVIADAVDATAAVAEAERLITVEGCKVIVGSYSSSISQAASEVAERNGVIYWETGGVAKSITERGFQYLFRVCPTSAEYGTIAADYTNDEIGPALGVDPKDLKIAIIYEDGAYGVAVSEAAEARAEELGLNVVVSEAYSATATDLSSLVMKVKAAEPDVIWATQYATDLLLFWKQAKELGLTCKAYVGTGGATGTAEFRDAFPAEDTQYVLNVAFASDGSNEAYANGLTEFYAAYEEKNGTPPPSVYTIVGYSGAKVLWQVLEDAGEMDPEKIREAALAIDIPEGSLPTGWGVKFAGPDEENAGQNLRAHNIVDQLQDGELVVLYPEAAKDPDSKLYLPLPYLAG